MTDFLTKTLPRVRTEVSLRVPDQSRKRPLKSV
jgi:hypothetical protein